MDNSQMAASAAETDESKDVLMTAADAASSEDDNVANETVDTDAEENSSDADNDDWSHIGFSKEDKTVRIGNFIVMKDADATHPFITVSSVSRNWYVGFAPDQMPYIFLDSSLFAEEVPSDDDLKGCMMYLVGLMASVTTFNADFTNNVIQWLDTLE